MQSYLIIFALFVAGASALPLPRAQTAEGRQLGGLADIASLAGPLSALGAGPTGPFASVLEAARPFSQAAQAVAPLSEAVSALRPLVAAVAPLQGVFQGTSSLANGLPS